MQTSEELIKAHAKELFGYLCRYAGDPALAEDLLGEVFVKFLMQYKTKTDPNFQWRPWLYRVATNLAISHFRRQKLWSFFGLINQAANTSEKPPHDVIEQSQDGQLLKTAIEQLGDKFKSVVIMRVYNEMSYDEIAYALKINVGTVKSRMNEAKARLKILLEDKYAI